MTREKAAPTEVAPELFGGPAAARAAGERPSGRDRRPSPIDTFGR
jgi:hypothetical protein